MKSKNLNYNQIKNSPPPTGINIPSKFAYIHSKAHSYLANGVDFYRAQDALGMPSEESCSVPMLELLDEGCRQILEWKGIEATHPFESIGIEGFYELMNLFHFEVIEQSTYFDADDNILDAMKVQHIITGEEMTLYNRISSNRHKNLVSY